jgi:nickel/cobalt exporter
LLGLSATISHTALIWILAFVGLHYSNQFNVETVEPYLQVATGVIVVGMAAWMFRRVRREQADAGNHHHHEHGPHGGTWIDTGRGFIEISVFETKLPPHFRLYFSPDKQSLVAPAPNQVATIETIRLDGTRQMFAFAAREDFLQSTTNIPEPHEFRATLSVDHHGVTHAYETEFTEEGRHHDHAHGHGHSHSHSGAFEDEHQREHALGLRRRFANRNVTTWQIILFALTGGLTPCPSAFAVLLLCLQLKEFALGFALVLTFSLGLALTLVTVGTIAAVTARQATKRFSHLGELAHKVPYVSSAVLAVIGVIVALTGLRHLL